MHDHTTLTRRGVLGAAAGVAAATVTAPPALAREADQGGKDRHGGRLLPRDQIGIQLFTVRDQVAAWGSTPSSRS